MTERSFTFSIKTIAFDENYRPADTTRITTNFANLARGERRQENLRNTLRMIDNRFNSLAHWDNPQGDRYSVVQFAHPTPWTILAPMPSTVTAENPLRYSAIAASDALDKVLYEINLVEDGRRVDADD